MTEPPSKNISKQRFNCYDAIINTSVTDPESSSRISRK